MDVMYLSCNLNVNNGRFDFQQILKAVLELITFVLVDDITDLFTHAIMI